MPHAATAAIAQGASPVVVVVGCCTIRVDLFCRLGAVAILIHLVIAVLGCARPTLGIAVIAVSSAGEDPIPVSILVLAVQAGGRVAVVVPPIAELLGSRMHRWILVIAVLVRAGR